MNKSVSFVFNGDCLNSLQELTQSASVSCNCVFLAQQPGYNSRHFLALICQL